MTEKKCPVCMKKLSKFKTGLLYRYDGKRFCSLKCKKKFMNTEVKCTCNKCGRVWYYTPREKKGQDLKTAGKGLIGGTAMAGNALGTITAALSKDERKLNQCPKCFSKEVKEEIIDKFE